MLYSTYSIGGELLHSAKGVEWKNKKYIDKIKTKTGKWRYIYKNKNTKENYEKMLNKHGIVTNKKKSVIQLIKDDINSEKRLSDINQRYHQEFLKNQNSMLDQREALSNNFKKNFGDFSKEDPWEHENEPDRKYNLDRRQELLDHLEKERSDSRDKIANIETELANRIDDFNSTVHPIQTAKGKLVDKMIYKLIDELDKKSKKKKK